MEETTKRGETIKETIRGETMKETIKTSGDDEGDDKNEGRR
jgi:hypothetical protein